MQSVGKQHSNAPAAEHWGLGGLSSVLPDKGVSPTAYAGAGGIVGKSQRSIHLKKKGRKSCFWDLVIIEKKSVFKRMSTWWLFNITNWV